MESSAPARSLPPKGSGHRASGRNQWDACVALSWRVRTSSSLACMAGRPGHSHPPLILGVLRRLVLRAASLRLSDQVWSVDPPWSLSQQGYLRSGEPWGGATC